MPFTYTVDQNFPNEFVGTKRVVSGTLTFDNSYPTGGLSFAPGQVGLTTLLDLHVEAGVAGTTGYVAAWNRSTTAPTVLVFQGDNPNAAQAPLSQVPNATNLSTLTARFTATGY